MHLILLVALASVSLPGTFSAWLNSSLDKAWLQWKAEFPKVYKEGEEEYRRSVWEENVKMIEQHNREYAEGKHTFEMAMNQFGDMTDEEFHQQMKGFPLDLETLHENKTFYQAPVGQTLPDHMDWRKKGRVTPVKNQGNCGSSWAFSATGALEALYANETGSLISFSEQYFIDCAQSSGYLGCQGGVPHWAFEYLHMNGRIVQEKQYPYKAKKGPCVFKCSKQTSFYNGYELVRPKDEQALITAVALEGPVSVGMAAPKERFYGKGILTSEHCGKVIDHAVLLVGYGIEKSGKKYWILKNSWGEKWGDKGYAQLKMGSNACKIAEYAVIPKYPAVAQGILWGGHQS